MHLAVRIIAYTCTGRRPPDPSVVAVGLFCLVCSPLFGCNAGPCARFLELNTWLLQVNGINILIDPVFGPVDFGVPYLIQGKKRVSYATRGDTELYSS